MNRLASAQTTSNLWGNTYVYDIWGNLLQKNLVPGKSDGEYLQQAVTTKNQLTEHCYDAAGNLVLETSCPEPPGTPFTPTYSYDAENRMTSTAGVTYTYDGDGKRVQKSTGKLYWYGMGSDPLEESDLSGTATSDFIFFNGKRIARLDLPGAVVHYYFSDHLGSTSVVTNASGSIEEESDYYPWGRERVITDILPDQNYKFTGKERDTESTLDNFGARYYSSQYGRFMSSDPLYLEMQRLRNPQNLNLYTYVLNNPLNLSDPTGLDVRLQCKAGDPCSRKDLKAQVASLNKRANAQFQVKLGKDGVLQIRGKVDPSKLSNSESALYQAITDKNNRATLEVKGADPAILFDKFEGNGKNSLDKADMSLLSKADQSAAGHVIAHAILEAYNSAAYGVNHYTSVAPDGGINPRLGGPGAHEYASNFFGGGESRGGRRNADGTYSLDVRLPTQSLTIGITFATTPPSNMRAVRVTRDTQ